MNPNMCFLRVFTHWFCVKKCLKHYSLDQEWIQIGGDVLEFISLLSQNQHAEFAKLHLEIIVPERSSITNIKRDTFKNINGWKMVCLNWKKNIPGDHSAQPCFMDWMDKVLNRKDNWQFCLFESICENVSQEAFLKADILENGRSMT